MKLAAFITLFTFSAISRPSQKCRGPPSYNPPGNLSPPGSPNPSDNLTPPGNPNPPADGCSQTVTVQEGEFLSLIADNNGVTVQDILALNPEITDPNLIAIGQEICIAGTPLTDGGGNGGSTGEAPPVDPNLATTVVTQCVAPGMFALTFDDGPAAANINELLALLQQRQVVATFFVNGDNFADLVNNQNDKDNLKAIFDQGHQVGTHTFRHADLSTLSSQQMFEEMILNENAIEAIIGTKPAQLRPPFLSASQDVLNAMGTFGYSVVSVNLDTKDFENSGDANEVALDLANVQPTIDGSNPAIDSFISLQHERTAATVEFTSQYIDLIQAKGYRFVTVAECTGLEGYRA